MSYSPRRAKEKNICGAVATPKGEYMDGTGGATPKVVQVHIHKLDLTAVDPYWLLCLPDVARY